jgi:hypothetical protein
MKKYKVYIASPYTNGWMPDNVRLQLEAKHILLEYGFIPFAPLENHFCEIYKHRGEVDWLNWDLEWLKVCDIVVRLHTKKDNVDIPSPGCDKEELTAKNNKIKMLHFNDLNELENWARSIATMPPDQIKTYQLLSKKGL